MFGKIRRQPLINNVSYPVPAQDPVNYASVIDYMVGLSAKDFEKLNKVATIYRDAEDSAAKVMGQVNRPTTKLVEQPDATEILGSGMIGMDFEDEELGSVIGAQKKKPVEKKGNKK